MFEEVLPYCSLVDLVPNEIMGMVSSLPVVEAGFGAGPGFIAVKRWQYAPPVSFLDAASNLELHRGLMRRCHVVFLDGSRLVMDRHQFHSFDPSVELRQRNAAKVGQVGILRERFRFNDFDEWPELLARAIAIFKKVHLTGPNLLVASPEVYAGIDEAATAHRMLVTDGAGRHPRRDEAFQISGFSSDGCDVGFVVADTIGFPDYLLMYDPDPDDGGEPCIIPGTSVSARMRKAA